MYKLSTQRTR